MENKIFTYFDFKHDNFKVTVKYSIMAGFVLGLIMGVKIILN